MEFRRVLFRSHVPSEDDEILRDLIRAREDAKEDLLRAKHRLTKFLLRRDIHPPHSIKRKWTIAYREWLYKLSFESSTLNLVFQEYYQQVTELEQRIQRLEKEIQRKAEEGFHAPIIQALQVLRGVSVLTATGLTAEIFSFFLFMKAGQLMANAELVPCESSSVLVRNQ